MGRTYQWFRQFVGAYIRYVACLAGSSAICSLEIDTMLFFPARTCDIAYCCPYWYFVKFIIQCYKCNHCSIVVYYSKLLYFRQVFFIASSLRAGLRASSSGLVEPRALIGRFRLGLSTLRAESSPSRALSSPSQASSLELCVHP